MTFETLVWFSASLAWVLPTAVNTCHRMYGGPVCTGWAPWPRPSPMRDFSPRLARAVFRSCLCLGVGVGMAVHRVPEPWLGVGAALAVGLLLVAGLSWNAGRVRRMIDARAEQVVRRMAGWRRS